MVGKTGDQKRRVFGKEGWSDNKGGRKRRAVEKRRAVVKERGRKRGWYTSNCTTSFIHIENVFRSVPVAVTVVEHGKRSDQSATVCSGTSTLKIRCKRSKFIKE